MFHQISISVYFNRSGLIDFFLPRYSHGCLEKHGEAWRSQMTARDIEWINLLWAMTPGACSMLAMLMLQASFCSLVPPFKSEFFPKFFQFRSQKK